MTTTTRKRSLRDLVFTRRVATRMTAPVATLGAGVGAAVPIALGVPVWLAGVSAMCVWVGVVVPEVLASRHPREQVDTTPLPEPWASFVAEAEDAAERYRRAIAGLPDGAVADRLDEIGHRVTDGVNECRRIARRGAALDAATHTFEDPQVLTSRLRALDNASDPTTEATRAALQAQLDSAARVKATRDEVKAKLQLLDARLDEAVARAVELAVGTETLDHAAAGSLSTTVDAVVSDMESLRQAVEETSALYSA